MHRSFRAKRLERYAFKLPCLDNKNPMSIKHILPNKTYSAQALYNAAEGEPFQWCFETWKKQLFTTGSGLAFTKGHKPNSSYRILGKNYIDFVKIPDNLKKFGL